MKRQEKEKHMDEDDGRRGSSDMGNLSHYLPPNHPYLAIVAPEIA
jgi:hypothetical protein